VVELGTDQPVFDIFVLNVKAQAVVVQVTENQEQQAVIQSVCSKYYKTVSVLYQYT
jgi:hypothetical protein